MNIEDRITTALEEIRPFLQADGGNIELIEIENEKVVIKLTGTCSSCSINHTTLKLGVETTIKKYAPEIKEVINIA